MNSALRRGNFHDTKIVVIRVHAAFALNILHFQAWKVCQARVCIDVAENHVPFPSGCLASTRYSREIAPK